MEKYKISIVVPVYNVEPYIDRCMQSLLSQSLKEVEIILVDDASPDKCPFLCDEYASQYQNVFVIHKQNAGLGYARNSGIDVARGEYICFIDSDDFIEPDMLERLYNECISENLDVIYSEFNVDNYPQYKVVLQPARLYQGHQEIEELQLDMIGAEPRYKSNVKFEPSACKGLYSMRIIREHNIYFLSEREYISEDLLFNLDILHKSSRVKIVPWQFYHYCLNESSLTHVYRADRWRKNLIMLEAIKLHIPNFDRIKDLNLRLSRTAIAYARMAIGIESHRKDVGTWTKVKNIKEMISNSVFVSQIADYPLDLLPMVWKIYGFLLKKKVALLLFIVSKIKK